MTDARSYEVKETLRNGQPVTIRAIRPEDRTLILEGLPGMDPHSLYLRFFETKKEITEGELEYFTEVDFVDHVALVVIADIDEKVNVIGGGRYVAYAHSVNTRSAELAFMVHDRHQGLGIAKLILKHLLIIARSNGIGQFEAEVLPENAKMLRVFARAGLPMNKSFVDGTIHVTLDLSSETGESMEPGL